MSMVVNHSFFFLMRATCYTPLVTWGYVTGSGYRPLLALKNWRLHTPGYTHQVSYGFIRM